MPTTAGSFRYNAKATYADVNDQDRYVQRFSASYVTGSHAFKAGFQLQQGVLNQDNIANQDVQYIFARGVPTTIVQWATPYQNRVRTRATWVSSCRINGPSGG